MCINGHLKHIDLYLGGCSTKLSKERERLGLVWKKGKMGWEWELILELNPNRNKDLEMVGPVPSNTGPGCEKEKG